MSATNMCQGCNGVGVANGKEASPEWISRVGRRSCEGTRCHRHEFCKQRGDHHRHGSNEQCIIGHVWGARRHQHGSCEQGGVHE